MLLDLERNDLGRVCEYGSVDVNEVMGLETYPEIHPLHHCRVDVCQQSGESLFDDHQH
jgi:hypothetical protein